MHIPAASLRLFLAVLLLSGEAFAQEQKLAGAEIKTALSDHALQGTREDGKQWQQIFQKSGVTFYSIGSAQSQGLWEVRGDQYCSQWPPNESWTCYDMALDADDYHFISASGQRSSGKLLN